MALNASQGEQNVPLSTKSRPTNFVGKTQKDACVQLMPRHCFRTLKAFRNFTTTGFDVSATSILKRAVMLDNFMSIVLAQSLLAYD